MGEKNTSKNESVLGIYSSRTGVENAISVLKDSGFSHTAISVLLPENPGSRELATEDGTKAPEGATAGTDSGAEIGGMLGWLVGIGALAIPGLEPFIAAGPIMVSVHCDTSDEIKRAKEIMERTGAEDISSAGEASTDTPSTKKAGMGY